jgi:alkylation response protein AidB-like acyl-CoA dehydrogenase
MPIDFELTPQQEKLRDTTRELAQDFAARALEHDAERSIPVENFEKMRDAGLYGLVVPEKYGGMGMGAMGWVIVAGEIAKVDAATAMGFNMHINATGGILNRHAEIPDEVRERVARLVLDEGALMCTSVSEPTSSSVLPLTYTPAVHARRADGGWTLHGRKFFASIFEAADYCYFYAHPEQIENFQHSIGLVVPTKQDGISVTDIWDTHGMRSTRSNQVDYDGAFVPEELVLYETENFLDSFIIEEADWAWGGFAAVYLGLAEGILEWAKHYVAGRKAKGYAQEMGYHPDISTRIGQMETEVEAARFLTWRAAWESDTKGPSPDYFRRWLHAKFAVANATQRLVTDALPACGLHALFRKEGFELKLRDAATAAIMPPNSGAAATMIGLLTMGLDPQQAPSLRLQEPEPAMAS